MAEGKIKSSVKTSKATKNKDFQPASNHKVENQEYLKMSSLKDDASTVEEPGNITYATNKKLPNNKINDWVILHNATKKPESRMTSFEKINIIREGISKKDLENLKEKTDLDYNQLSKVLSVARATLINKKGTAKFDMVLSERIVGVADIYSYGYEVFEDETRFNDWIFRANQSLGGQSPYDLLDNQYGREEVKNLIGRIDYGVYS
ncbi:MAG: type II RES/Xre toxin-antitoxin system antitoxin [Segetibacter sp.]